MVLRLLAAAVAAALLVPAEGLATQGFLGADRGGPLEVEELESQQRLHESVRAYLDQALKSDDGLAEEERTVMDELANSARMETVSKAKQGQELQMVEDMLKELDELQMLDGSDNETKQGAENETNDLKTARHVAAVAFRKAIRNHLRRPAKAKRHHKEGEPAEDLSAPEDLNAWVHEANRAAQELEKEAKNEESDLGEAVPKGEEEKNLRRVADLIDEVDPKNASEMADLGDALAQVERRPKRKAARRSNQIVSASDADSKMVEAMRSWMAEANKAAQDLEKEAKHEESDLGEAVPKGEEEKNLRRVADLIDEVDPKNASEMADLADALAQVERRPKRKAARRSNQIVSASDADSKMVEAMRSWMAEANKASQDLEKEAKNEESDLGEAVPKGEEEKNLRRVADLIDEVDPKNASEMADLGDALAQDRTSQRKLKTRGEGDAKVDAMDSNDGEAKESEERRGEAAAAALETPMIEQGHPSRANLPEEGLAKEGEGRQAEEAMKSWVAEADKATNDIDREIDEAIDELKDEAPKSDEEKDLERMQNLIDATDPDNASEVADLAASLARSGSFTRRVGKFAAPPASGWSQKVAKEFWSWLKSAETESRSLDRDLDASTKELSEYLKGMTSKQEFAVHKELEMLEEIWAKYGLENESATAEDVMEKLVADAPAAA